jgi:hypothetical protein
MRRAGVTRGLNSLARNLTAKVAFPQLAKCKHLV